MVKWIALWTCSVCLVYAGPLHAQTLQLEPVGVIPGPASLVRASGSHAYRVAGVTLSVIDISDPSAPRVRGSITLPETIYGFTVSGSVAYVANGLRGLAVLELSNPDAPQLVGSVKTAGETLRVALTGTRAVLTDRMSGVVVIDVSNPAKPVSLGSYYTEGYARDVAVAGSLAYIVDSSTDFSILDVSKQGPPAGLSTQESAPPPALVAVGGRSGESGQNAKIVYVMGSGTLQVYDVSNPSSPAKVGTTKIPNRTQAVAIDGALAYVAGGPDGLQILDLSEPSRPATAGSFKTSGAAVDVAVSGSLVLIAVAESKPDSPAGIVILRKRP